MKWCDLDADICLDKTVWLKYNYYMQPGNNTWRNMKIIISSPNAFWNTNMECMKKVKKDIILLQFEKAQKVDIYKDIKADVGQILGTLCRRKGIEIVETECMPDHVHMLVRIPPKYSVSEIMGYLKGKSSLMIFEKHGNLKYKYGNRHFWCRGYYVDTVGKNTAAIKAYIENQIKEDLE